MNKFVSELGIFDFILLTLRFKCFRLWSHFQEANYDQYSFF